MAHEIDAYHFGDEEVWGEKIFEDLIAEKWEKFARGVHIWWHVVPNCIVLIVFMVVLFTRTSSVYEEAVGRGRLAPGRWPPTRAPSPPAEPMPPEPIPIDDEGGSPCAHAGGWPTR